MRNIIEITYTTNEELALTAQATQDKAKRQDCLSELVSRFTPFINNCVSRFDCVDTPVTKEDLWQDAVDKLMQCALAFDQEKRKIFAPYAVDRIRWHVNEQFYRMCGQVRSHCKAEDHPYKQTEAMRRPVSFDDEMGWCERFQDKDFWNTGVRPSLRAANLLDQLSGVNSAEDECVQRETLEHLKEAMKDLDDEEKSVIEGRYVLCKKWDTIKEENDISKRKALYVRNRALDKLRVAMA